MRASEVELKVPLDCLGAFVECFHGEYHAPVKITGPVTVLDIGANVGAFAMWASVQWPHATIYCYEPQPELFEYLKHNTRHVDRCNLFNCAVGDPNRTTLYYRDDTRLCCTQYDRGDSTGSIQVASVSPVVLPMADIVKVDVEGAEFDVLRDIHFTPRLLMLEWHSEIVRQAVDQWAVAKGMMLVKSNVRLRHLGISVYAKEEA